MAPAVLQYAEKASLSLVLPCSVLLFYLREKTLDQGLQVDVLESKTLSNKCAAKLTLEDSTVFNDQEIFHHLAKLSIGTSGCPRLPDLEEWISRAEVFSTPDFRAFRKAFEELNAHLTLRSCILGYRQTFADLLVWATIRGNHLGMASLRNTDSNVARWYNFVEASSPWLTGVVESVVAASRKERSAARAAASAAGASYDIELPGVDGPVVTRFPPEPSGYLHIGHAKAALLNDHFAHLKPGGSLLCRFDDTNPSNERMEFQDAILLDLKLMNIVPDRISYSSDYFQQMHDYAVQLIKDGKAFADDSELGKGNKDRENRLPSKRRDLGIDETLARFEDMKTGSEEGRRWALRAHIAYDSPNGTLRDPVIYRCNLQPHHRTGTTWKVYPTYDFCAPILDSIEGVTVALRTNEYRDRNAQYEWMQDALRLRKVPIWDFSRLNFIRTVLSKRKLTRIVDEGQVWGWDDPRMPTIRGIVRRGVVVPALREFILKQGPSRNVLNLEWGTFWALNRKYIDPTAPRHTAIVTAGAVSCAIRGQEGPKIVSKPKHGKNPDLGTKKVFYDSTILLEGVDAATFEQDEEITLMNWGNAFVRGITRDEHDAITGLDLELHLEGDVKKTSKKVTWLASTEGNLVPVDLVSFDYLITKDKLEKTDELEDFLTPVTEFRVPAFADGNVAELPQGAIVQFERKGFYKLDVAYRGGEGEGSRAVLFEIPSKG
ncbi:glutamyl-tRNA synthetase [Xylariomycetidae sp. FL2044]|nr:glutamyl-tRNA synthetase [Xylariomycetidae sp. FL2044]